MARLSFRWVILVVVVVAIPPLLRQASAGHALAIDGDHHGVAVLQIGQDIAGGGFDGHLSTSSTSAAAVLGSAAEWFCHHPLRETASESNRRTARRRSIC